MRGRDTFSGMNALLQRAVSAPAAFLFPAVCPCCDRGVGPVSPHACDACFSALESAQLLEQSSEQARRCRRCFQILERPLVEQDHGDVGNPVTLRCSYCRSRQVFFDRHRSLLPMQGGWREVVHRWKFENDRRLWRLLWAICNASPVLAELRAGAIDRIVWIVSGSAGRRTRNYQPCKDIARALAQTLAVSCGPDLRKRSQKTQSAQSYADRFFMIHDSLEFRGPPGPGNWLLLEDVFTTGATANEAARILKKNGALQVFVLSLFLRDGSGG